MESTNYPTYSAADVVRLLDYPSCIDAVREAMAGLTATGFEQPLRSIVPLGAGRMFGLMPGVGHADLGFGAKILSVSPDPSRNGRSAHRGVVVLFDATSGAVRCVADAGAITEIRTGCASAVATHALARKDARVLAIFGTGTQARSHVLAVSRVRPFTRLIIWGRDRARAEELSAGVAGQLSLQIETTQDGRGAAEAADVICTTTGAETPILFRDWVRPGTHINVVGSSFLGPIEVDSALVRDSRYIADYRRSALAAASEFAVAKQQGLVTDEHIVAEIGEVLLGRVPGRRTPEEITMYKSLGHIVQDLAGAACVDDRARRDRS
jgi:ornithine cyclodeaminase/alanine dehydrogenase-like protein (mu-crystallin family)